MDIKINPVKLMDLPPGFAFVTLTGVLAFKTEYSYHGANNDQCICYLFGSGEAAFFRDGNDTLVTPVQIISETDLGDNYTVIA